MRNFSFTHYTELPKGFIHIDDSRFPAGIGGIRLIKGVTESEVVALAKAMSRKLHIFGFPLSGAKGGIDSDNIEDFYEFINDETVKSLIQGDNKSRLQLITGPDIGTSEEEYYIALKKAGLEKFIRKGLLSNSSKKYGLPLDNIVTAYGVIIAAEILLKHLNIDLFDSNTRCVIEGFGKVGTGLASILNNQNKLVAISTRYGAISNSNGLETSNLIKLQNKYGDKLLNYYAGAVSTEELFDVPCDLLIPGARTGVITEEIAFRIVNNGKPKAIVPVANSPYTPEGLKLLQENGIICFPDFLASAGAVIAAMIEFAHAGGEVEALELVKQATARETLDLIQEVEEEYGSLSKIYEFAVTKSLNRKNELIENIEKNPSDFNMEQLAKKIIHKYMKEI